MTTTKTFKQLGAWMLLYFFFNMVFESVGYAIGLDADLFNSTDGTRGVLAKIAIIIGSWMLANRALQAYQDRKAAKK